MIVKEPIIIFHCRWAGIFPEWDWHFHGHHWNTPGTSHSPPVSNGMSFYVHTIRLAEWLHFVHEIAVPISQSPQCGWWGLTWVKMHGWLCITSRSAFFIQGRCGSLIVRIVHRLFIHTHANADCGGNLSFEVWIYSASHTECAKKIGDLHTTKLYWNGNHDFSVVTCAAYTCILSCIMYHVLMWMNGSQWGSLAAAHSL